ncbi:MAG: hypothetical protein NWE86_01020, partial [Candidatus Bathyarchaeota archaeon]|nr:hypothetical protein [Candidatus Bathyarchaeota archaeon]
MKKYWIAFLLLVILVFFFIEFNTLNVDQNINDQSMIEIRKESVVGQTFLSEYNDLCKVEVYLRTYIEAGVQEIVLHLRSDPNSKVDITNISIEMYNSVLNEYFEFNFRPIENSKDKSYYFFLESIDSENVIFVLYNSNDAYLNGSAYIDNSEKGGDLQFRTYYKTRPIYVLVHFFDRAFQDIPFFIFYSFLIFLLAFILFRIRNLLKEMGDNKNRKIKNFLKYAFLLNLLFFGFSLKLLESPSYPIYSIDWISSIIAGKMNLVSIVQFFSLIMTIVLGSLTLWVHKEVFEEVETEQESELKEEERRKSFFAYIYPKINRIPIFNSIVKWMYKEGWHFSTGLMIIVLVGFGLRIYGVGDFDFREDEFQVIYTASSYHFGGGFYTWDWIKSEPSGNLYMRAWPHTWLIAKSFDIFGISEFSARLVSVIFGTILILV